MDNNPEDGLILCLVSPTSVRNNISLDYPTPTVSSDQYTHNQGLLMSVQVKWNVAWTHELWEEDADRTMLSLHPLSPISPSLWAT